MIYVTAAPSKKQSAVYCFCMQQHTYNRMPNVCLRHSEASIPSVELLCNFQVTSCHVYSILNCTILGCSVKQRF